MCTFAFTFPDKDDAQMAELVDALVSNTNGCKSLSVRSRLWVPIKICINLAIIELQGFCFYKVTEK